MYGRDNLPVNSGVFKFYFSQLSTMSHQQSRAPPTMDTSHVKLIPAKLKLTRASPSDKYRSDAAPPLTRENYRKKFIALLHLEEEVHNKLLKEK